MSDLKVNIIKHPLIQHKLTLMRKKETGAKDFRQLLDEISMLMAYEVTRDFPTKDIEIETKTVIVTTGAAVKWLGLPGEKELIGRGISGCATCDGMFFRGKTVAVVGGGDTACEEADFLAKICQKVYLIHRRDELRASATEQKKVLNNPKIEIWWNSEVKGLKGKEKLEAVEVINNKTQEKKELILDGLFVAIGSQPATEFLKGLVELSPTGQVLTGGDKNWVTMTSVPGIFAGGDCVNNRHKQAIVAAGEGCRAALDAENWLNS